MPGYGVLLYIGAAGVALGLAWRLIIRPMARLAQRISQFLEDWAGEPPRPGLPDGRKGVLERLDALESRTKRTEWHLGNGDAERMRDVVNRIDAKQKSTGKAVSEVASTVAHIDETVTPDSSPSQ